MPAQPEHDFEDRLAQALRRAGDGFHPDGPHLTAGGAARGRRRQRRRFALAAAVVAVVAAAGLTSVVLPPGGAGTAVGPAASPTASPSGGTQLPQEAHVVSAVAERLPAGVRILRSAGDSFGASGLRADHGSASLTLDDGHGASMLSVVVSSSAGQRLKSGCPLSNSPNETCEVRPGPNGGSLTVGSSSPDATGPKGTNTALYDGPNGLRVVLSAFDFADDLHQDRTRDTPLLTVDQLAALAVDPVWRTFAESLTPVRPGSGEPRMQNVRLASLLPSGLKATGGSEGSDGQSATATRGEHTVVLTAREQQADRAVRDWFAGTPARPDGTRVRSVAGRAVPGAQGATESVVDVLRPDGVRIRVTAVNPAGAGSPDAGLAPLLTVDQLEAIALNPGWNAPTRA